jgi:hypothetical protein
MGVLRRRCQHLIKSVASVSDSTLLKQHVDVLESQGDVVRMVDHECL